MMIIIEILKKTNYRIWNHLAKYGNKVPHGPPPSKYGTKVPHIFAKYGNKVPHGL